MYNFLQMEMMPSLTRSINMPILAQFSSFPFHSTAGTSSCCHLLIAPDCGLFLFKSRNTLVAHCYSTAGICLWLIFIQLPEYADSSFPLNGRNKLQLIHIQQQEQAHSSSPSIELVAFHHSTAGTSSWLISIQLNNYSCGSSNSTV